VIARSSADFVDVHPYPGFGYSLDQYMESYGITGTETKPIVIGEMGAGKEAFASPADAAAKLTEWQAASCRYGIDGWLIWTWDTDEQPDLWNARSGGGVIGRSLAPVVRPDPCAAAN
jgi:orotidine-5'-phosphate decarboxylase